MKKNLLFNKSIISLFLVLFSYPLAFAQDKELMLNEVTIVASRTTNSTDGYITNLKGSNIVKGKMASEILSFLPNISNEAGNYKINGLAVSNIYINGVKLADLSELNNIPGDMIDKVNVKFLAGADQNAALSGGTIHITLRRPQDGGYYGSIKASAEWSRASKWGNEHIGSLLYYRYKNLSIYDNMEFRLRKTESNTEQWMNNTDLYTLFLETSQSKGTNYRNRFSFVQKFNTGIKFGGSYFLSVYRPKFNSHTQGDNNWSSISKSTKTIVQAVTLQYSMPLNKQKASLEVTADYFNRTNNTKQNYIENEDFGSINEKNNLNLWKLKTDVEYPNKHKQIWKFGASLQYISSSQVPSNAIINERFLLNTTHTRTTGFTPSISAEVSGVINTIKYGIGINWQRNQISYETLEEHSKSHNTQKRLNPIVKIMLPLNDSKSNVFLLNYKRTLDDIPYSAISSVITWKDAYNYTTGNPELKAPSTDILMAGLSLFRNKINITTIYARLHNNIYWQTFQNNINPDIIYTKPINLAGQNSWGISVEWIETPTKWWNYKLAGRAEIAAENAILNGKKYDKTHLKEYFYFNNSFYFSNNWGAMINIDLEPRFYSFDRTYHTISNVTGRLYKSFKKNKVQLCLDFSPFSIRRKMDRQLGKLMITYKDTTPVQYVNLTATWKFSSGKKVTVDIVEGIQNYKDIIDNK